MKLVVTHSPHIKTPQTTKRIMTDVLIALIPVSISAVFNFGMSAVLLMLVCLLTAMLTESLLKNSKKHGLGYALKPVNLFSDGSAAVTGLIFAHILTPTLPWWMAVIGTFICIYIGKYIFGGIGQNSFNPALVGRAALAMAFAAYMGQSWIFPDGVATATPLVTRSSDYLMMFLGRTGGCLGETSFIGIMLGALYLLYRGHITLHTPVAFLASTGLLSFLFSGTNPLYAVLAGGVAYGAVFMATDMVTTPMTRRGQLIFGLGCGLITTVIREFGALPEGVMYSILIMNAFTPLIDKLVKPRLFGGGVNA